METSMDILNSSQDQVLCLSLFFVFWVILYVLVFQFAFSQTQMSEEKKIKPKGSSSQ